MAYILLLFALYITLAIFLKLTSRETYSYRKFNILEYVIDLLLIPFMNVISDGKDSHWWDWKKIEIIETKLNFRLLKLTSDFPQKRTYKTVPLLGQYNLSGLKDLYITLRVLRETYIIKPKNYSGKWSLIVGKHSYADKNKFEYMVTNFLHQGAIKYLVDGETIFLGLDKGDNYIALELIKTCTRKENKELLFL